MAFISVFGAFCSLLSFQIRSIQMRKAFAVAVLLAAGLAITTAPAVALQVVVTHVDKNADGSMTYHFAVKMDPGEALTPG
jgi:hypothetical protein